jgi:hypothetical protein
MEVAVGGVVYPSRRLPLGSDLETGLVYLQMSSSPIC